MSSSLHQFGRDVIQGNARGPAASLLRGGLNVIEPFYAAAMRGRNFLFDRGMKRATRLPRPVISVGNITTGGTGKTPLVAWLADRCRGAARRPAILTRGYKSSAATISDERVMLENLLDGGGSEKIVVQENPDRVAGATEALRRDPKIDLFILDDGFQHRRVIRDADLVLINAADPFGHGHVLPRGLLREPLTGLRRASVFLLTHAGENISTEIESTLRRHNPTAPIFRCDHVHDGFITAAAREPAAAVAGRKFFAFSGIGDPDSFGRQLRQLPGEFVGHQGFADHHHYTPADLVAVQSQARSAGADLILTTEKDWVKIAAFPTDSASLPIWRVNLRIAFAAGDESRLIDTLLAAVRPR